MTGEVQDMKKLLLAVIAVTTLGGCTLTYERSEVAISPERIQTINANGAVTLVNGQPNTTPENVWRAGGTKVMADYNTVTQAIVDQMSGELSRMGNSVKGGGSKKITVAVNRVDAFTKFVVNSCLIKARVTLGSGKVIDIDVHDNTGGNATRAINSAVAISVIKILNHPEVRAYLKS